MPARAGEDQIPEGTRSGPMTGRGFAGRTMVAAVVAAAALLALAGGAQAKTRKAVGGGVVHRNQHAGSFLVADHKGHPGPIPAPSSPALGTNVPLTLPPL